MSTTTKTCPITHAAFKSAAPKLAITFDQAATPGDAAIWVAAKAFSSGAVGLWGQGKATISVGGKPVPFQIGANLVLLGSADKSVEEKAALVQGIKPMLLKLHVVTDATPAPQGSTPAATKAPFSTGSFGWNVSAKLATDEGFFQCGVNVTGIGSKECPDAPKTAPKA